MSTESLPLEGVAIVGLAGRFPGANNVHELWENLCAGRESITRFTEEELRASGLDPALLADPAYVPARATLADADMFDAGFFGMNPRDAELTDPQHRVLLECAWHALEDAALDPARFRGSIGVYAGASLNTYLLDNLASQPGLLADFVGQFQADGYPLLIGSDKDYLSTRLSYKLDLKGPSITVQTACSTSLVAVCQAVQALLGYQCDAALAGGVSITFPQARGHLYQEGSIVSGDGHCRPFDAEAKGTVFGHGCGMVVLKRLSDAVADRDQIYAVIRGAALNNDGAGKVSYMAPSIEGQAEVISLAHALAGVTAGTIGYVEAHGTGTPLGDPIEVAALTQAFRATTDRRGFCKLGTVKSNFGHLEAAAGVTGLIKTALALRHGQIPPTVHFKKANPRIDFASSPFTVSAELSEWPRSATPRRAGVSSFGVGGTNAHVVLEETPEIAAAVSDEPVRSQLLVLSARSEAVLDNTTANLAARLGSVSSLRDVAFTLQSGRRTFDHRRIVVCGGIEEASSLLASRDPKRVLSQSKRPAAPEVIFVFPGQGSQFAGMGAALAVAEPIFRAEWDRSHSIAARCGISELRDRTQADLFCTEFALARLFMAWGIQPSAMLGHSLGEYVAATLAGVFTLEDALRVVIERARLVETLPGGVMLAARLSEGEAAALAVGGISLAVSNSPSLSVLSGSVAAITALETKLESRGVAAKRLASPHAYHSSLLDPILERFQALLKSVRLEKPAIRYLSNVTGQWITDAEATDPQYWVSHLRQTVRFSSCATELVRDENRVLVEVGPGTVLTQILRQHGAKHAFATLLPGAEFQSTLTALGRLWLAGIEPDWAALNGAAHAQRVSLPGYPFERQRYWIEPVRSNRVRTALTKSEPRIGQTPSATDVPAMDAPAAAPLDVLRTFLSEQSGLNLADANAGTSLLELGFDSLFLTQAAIALKRQFGIKITFRQLLEELSTLGALANFIEQHALACTNAATTDKPASFAPQLLTSSGTPAQQHGPFRPLQKEMGGALTDQQQRWLDDFITRYTARTPGSKRHTQTHRPHFADPRAVAGFKDVWKEIVYPIVVEKSQGAHMWDIDGNEYIDTTMGFGSALFGHQPPFVMQAIREQMEHGMEIGPSHPVAGEVAKLLCELTGHERATFCNTGSEAVLGAIRIARTVSGRTKIALFAGAYHGINDEALVRPLIVNGEWRTAPIAPGIVQDAVANVLVLEYGNPHSLEFIRANADELAAVLVEPVQSRHPDLQPREFLHHLRALTAERGIALVMDEVITGFRCHPGGAQAYFGVKGDIATYGKVIGGGLPIGVITGSSEYMDAFDGGAWQFGDSSFPSVGVTFFAGTFVRHPLALAAARAVLRHLQERGVGLQNELAARTAGMIAQIAPSLEGTPFELPHFTSAFYVRVNGFKYSGLLFALLRLRGIHIWEGRPCFLGTAHTAADIDRIATAFRESLEELRSGGFFAGTATVVRPGDPIPLTDAQREIWLAAQVSKSATAAYNESCTLRLRGKFDQTGMRAAIDEVLQRHDALRSTFRERDGAQSFTPALALDVQIEDLSGAAAAEQRLAELQIQEAAQDFDLVHGPIVAFRLVRLAEEEHALLFTAHHLACDGWSYDIVLRELAQLYSSYASADRVDLRPAAQFADYARRENGLRGGEDAVASQAFWLERFRTLPPPFDLPSDLPRPLQRTWAGDRRELLLAPELKASVQEVGTQHGCTMFVTLFGAFQTLLHRLSGQTDFVVGIFAAGQNLTGGEDLVGHCANTLPLRTQVKADGSFAELLGTVRGAVLDAFDYQHYTFSQLLDQLRPTRDPSRVPLVPVTFNVDPPLSEMNFGSLAHDIVLNPRQHFQFELAFNIVDSPEGLCVQCDYNPDLFSRETIDRWLGHYEVLLRGAVCSTTCSLAKLPLLRDSDRQKIVVNWNQTEAPLPLWSVSETIATRATEAPDRIAVECEGEPLTYRDLESRAAQLGGRLQAAGVVRGDLVGVCLERSPEMIVTVLAILKAGAAYVPLDPAFPSSRLGMMIEDSRMSLIVSYRRFVSALPAENVGILLLDSSNAPAAAFTPVQIAAEDRAYVLFTSGSTGRPKGVAVPHRALANLLEAMRLRPGFTSTDTLLAITTLSFDIATLELLLPLVAGGKVVIATREIAEDPQRLAAELERAGTTVMQATPATWRGLVSSGWQGSKRLKIISGGEALAPDLAARLLALCGEVWNQYGPTETAIYSTAEKLISAEPPICIGHPIANTRVYILNPALEPQPIGVPGELYIAGEGLALGYLHQPELTAEKFIDDPFSSVHGAKMYRTGDLARFRADRRIEYLGRLDQQVKVRGFRIERGEVESTIRAHPAIANCAVVARQFASGDERLVAYYTLRNGTAVDEIELRKRLASTLPVYMVPSNFVALPHLPLTPNGKLDQRALPAPDAGVPARSASAPPRTELERDIVELWQRVLGREGIGVTDDFFELGGHSLLAIQLLAQVREKFSVDFPVRKLFETPTVEGLARFVEANRPPPGSAVTMHSLVPIQRGAAGQRPFFLVPGGWGGEIEFLVYGMLARHLGPEQPLYGLKARGGDGSVRPHENLTEMVADYVAEMRSLQPHGPYLLGGECVGGVLAYEIARHLESLGEIVGLLVLLDTDRPTRIALKRFCAAQRKEARDRFWETRIQQPAQEHLDKLSHLSALGKLRYLWQRALRHGHHSNGASGNVASATPLDERKILESYPKILMGHDPGPYRGKVTLLIDETSHREFGKLGWESIPGVQLEVHVLPGTHLSYIRENAALVAAKLRDLIAAANSVASV